MLGLCGALMFLTGCAAGSAPVVPPPTFAAPTVTAEVAATPAVASPPVIQTVTPSADVVVKLTEVEAFVSRVRGRSLEGEVPRSFVDSADMHALLDDELADPETVASIHDEELLAGGTRPHRTER